MGWIVSLGCLDLLVTLLNGFMTCGEGITGSLAPGEPNRYAWIFWAGVGLVGLSVVFALVVGLRKGKKS